MKSFLWSEFDFPSTLKLAGFVKNLLDSVDSRGKNLSRMELGLHEALVNAVLHGNGGDSEKRLRIRRILTPNWIVWQIQDQGKGIPFKSRVSSLPSQLDVESGRGLFLIHECFDDVRWSNKGNRIQVATRRH